MPIKAILSLVPTGIPALNFFTNAATLFGLKIPVRLIRSGASMSCT